MRHRRDGNASSVEGCIYRMPALAQACTQAARAPPQSKCCAMKTAVHRPAYGPRYLPHSPLTHGNHSHPSHALDSSLLLTRMYLPLPSQHMQHSCTRCCRALHDSEEKPSCISTLRVCAPHSLRMSSMVKSCGAGGQGADSRSVRIAQLTGSTFPATTEQPAASTSTVRRLRLCDGIQLTHRLPGASASAGAR